MIPAARRLLKTRRIRVMNIAVRRPLDSDGQAA
jgi:hypothetical protein